MHRTSLGEGISSLCNERPFPFQKRDNCNEKWEYCVSIYIGHLRKKISINNEPALSYAYMIKINKNSYLVFENGMVTFDEP